MDQISYSTFSDEIPQPVSLKTIITLFFPSVAVVIVKALPSGMALAALEEHIQECLLQEIFLRLNEGNMTIQIFLISILMSTNCFSIRVRVSITASLILVSSNVLPRGVQISAILHDLGGAFDARINFFAHIPS